MTPPVPLHDALHVAGVMLQEVLSCTWQVTPHTMFSEAVQLVAQSVAQTVVAGVKLQEYEQCPWQAVTQSVLDDAPHSLWEEHSDSH